MGNWGLYRGVAGEKNKGSYHIKGSFRGILGNVGQREARSTGLRLKRIEHFFAYEDGTSAYFGLQIKKLYWHAEGNEITYAFLE